MVRRLARLTGPAALALLALSATFAGACESRVSLGARCTLDGECSGLRCLYGRCRAECGPGRDCGGALTCNDGVCATADESCSAVDPCDAPELACAGSICAPRCVVGACQGGAVCEERLGEDVCVPAERSDAGLEPDAQDETDAGPPVTSVASRLCASPSTACFVRPDQRVYCWGWNQAGMLGDGTSRETGHAFTPPGRCGDVDCAPAPAAPVNRWTGGGVEPLEGITSIGCGDGFACASDGATAHCWGGVGNGDQLGYDGPGAVASISATDASRVLVGRRHACVLGSGGPRCWGENAYDGGPADGRLGHTASPSTYLAMPATRFAEATQLALGGLFTCMGHAAGVDCAGYNQGWVIGTRTIGPSPEGGRIPGISTPPTDLIAGSAYACAIVDGTVLCWGRNDSACLARGVAVLDACDGYVCDETARPVAIERVLSPTPRFARLARTESDVMCAITEGSARVVCWGNNHVGQAGIDPAGGEHIGTLRSYVETEGGAPLEGVVEVACGGEFCCAARADAHVFCWGQNDVGQLGRGMIDVEAIDADAPDAGTFLPGLPHHRAVEVDWSAIE